MKTLLVLVLSTLFLNLTALSEESQCSSTSVGNYIQVSHLKPCESQQVTLPFKSRSTTEQLKLLEFHSLEKSQQTVTVESGWIGHPERPNIPWLICQKTSVVKLSLLDYPPEDSTIQSQQQEVKSTHTTCNPLSSTR